jgi:hypothetical protein
MGSQAFSDGPGEGGKAIEADRYACLQTRTAVDEFLVELIAGIIELIVNVASTETRNLSPDTYAILTGRPTKNHRRNQSIC